MHLNLFTLCLLSTESRVAIVAEITPICQVKLLVQNEEKIKKSDTDLEKA